MLTFDGSSGSLSGSSEQNTEAEKTASESKKRVKQKQSVAVQKESHYVDEIEALMDFIGDTLKEEVRNTDYLMIDETCELVGIEPEERKVQREKQSVPIMTRLYARAKTMSKDMELMSNSLMRKAVNYLLNQWNRLRNFILDGRVQISNLSGRIHRTSVQLHRTGRSGQKSSFAMLLCQ